MSMDQPARINFFKGHPSFRLLPNEEIVEATRQLLTSETRDYDDDTRNRHPLTYGPDEGALWVRQQICDFNNRSFGSDSKPEFLNLSSGSSYGCSSVLLHTTLPHTNFTRQAFIISPTYFSINDCFIDAGFGSKLTAIDEEGEDSINFEQLLSKLRHFEELYGNSNGDVSIIQNPNKPTKKVYKYVMYCVPTFANPSGKSYSLETRTKLIEIARRYDMLIICDDVYDLLDYSTDVHEWPRPQKRLVHIDRATAPDDNEFGNTISNATFSKIIAPGLRFGYHETINDKLAAQLSRGGANVSGGTPSQLNSMIVGTILQNGSMERILGKLRETYKTRSVAMWDSLQKHMPKDTHISSPKGGYFVWVTLPPGYDAKKIGKKLKDEHGVISANGSDFEVIGDERGWGDRSVRLSISFLETPDIIEGCELWGKVCKEMAPSS